MANTSTGALLTDEQAGDAVAITKSDTTVLTGIRGVYVGTTGDVSVITQAAWDLFTTNGTAPTAVTFTSFPAGAILPVHVAKVMSTSTTASGFIGLR